MASLGLFDNKLPTAAAVSTEFLQSKADLQNYPTLQGFA